MKNLTYTATVANGDTPDATPINQKFTDIATFITGKLDPDNLVNGPAYNLLVCNASGVPIYSLLGTNMIADNAVTTPKIADNAVTASKLNLAGTYVDAALAGSDTDISGGHNFTLATLAAGTYEIAVHAVYDLANAGVTVNQLVVGIVPLGTRMIIAPGVNGVFGDMLLQNVTVDGATALTFNAVPVIGGGGHATLKATGSYWRAHRIGP